MSQFQIRLATLADIELISWHRARMFQDMGELPTELFDSFRTQSLETLQQMFEGGKYVGWLASPEHESERMVAGAGVHLANAGFPQPTDFLRDIKTVPVGVADVVVYEHRGRLDTIHDPDIVLG